MSTFITREQFIKLLSKKLGKKAETISADDLDMLYKITELSVNFIYKDWVNTKFPKKVTPVLK